MLIAQLSDLHLAGWGRKTLGIVPMAENLARCVDHINHLTLAPDLVLVTGDLTHNGQRDEMERAASILARLHPPFYVLPGNHDDRAAMLSVFGHATCPVNSETFVNYVIEGYDLRLIGLNSTVPDGPGGEISPEQAAWLDKRLAEGPLQPTLLFMHHPPVKFGVIETDIDGFVGAERLGDVLERHPQVQRILAGHTHLSSLTQWRNVVVSTAPSMGMRLFLDLTLTLPSAFVLDDPAYQLHYWTPDQRLITHTVQVTAQEDLHSFTEAVIDD
ncbi:MAG: phosphodiesterase [Clostridia bacterium]|nr:MAG: phosphodiesterase [Clostridia bacterium]